MEFFLDLPLYLRLFIGFGFGVIIGSFLNVYLYRLHTGRSLVGESHCLSCGSKLKAYELIPLLSYLALRGRCRNCSSHIPVRYFLVEALTGILFVLVTLLASDLFTMFIWLLFVSVLVVVAVYDIYHMIIPDELVIVLTGVAMVSTGYTLWQTALPAVFMFDLLAAIAGASFFFLLWQMSKGKWIGFGDVKLAVPLGLMVGCGGVFSMIVLSFWIGAIYGVSIILLQKLQQRGKYTLRLFGGGLTMKSAVPFAPFLILGFLSVLFFKINVITWLSFA